MAKIMTRSLYAVVNTKVSWNSAVVLTKEACSELVFWSHNVNFLNCLCPWLPLGQPAKLLYSDPSFIVRARFFNKIGLLLKETTVPRKGSLKL